MQPIPKIIHYCWFGNQPKPSFVDESIACWRKIVPQYEILEWNENNFNIGMNDYVRQAYETGMFAFVSDYARLYAMLHHGGIYLDTDVELLRPFDELLQNDVVLGFEQNNFVCTSTMLARKNSRLIGHFLDAYDEKTFVRDDGSWDLTTNVQMLTDIMVSMGLRRNNQTQILSYSEMENVLVLEQQYLSPFNCISKIRCDNASTYTVHHFKSSWSNVRFRIKMGLIEWVRAAVTVRYRKQVISLINAIF